MFRLIILLLFAYIGFKIIKTFTAASRQPDSLYRAGKGEETVQDPVCGMYLSKTDAIVGNLEGEKYYFCSMDCLNKFRDQLEINRKSKTGGI